jgi:hypothetical protein
LNFGMPSRPCPGFDRLYSVYSSPNPARRSEKEVEKDEEKEVFFEFAVVPMPPFEEAMGK